MTTRSEAIRRQPALFLSHGTPMLGLQEDEYTQELQRFGASLAPRPRAIVIVSAHGLSSPPVVELHAAEKPKLIYDFRGFPGELYLVEYPCPGAPDLAATLASRLSEAGFESAIETSGGLDHGVWVPLKIAFPAANIPVLQITMPYPAQPEQVLKLGRVLAPLRDEGVLVIGSGGMVHNLSKLVWHQKHGPAEPWALEFDRWVCERLEARDVQALIHFEEEAPHGRLAHPEPEHFFPLFFTLGASAPGDRLHFIYRGFQYASLSMTSFALLPPEAPGSAFLQ